jgi:hypothetical protein
LYNPFNRILHDKLSQTQSLEASAHLCTTFHFKRAVADVCGHAYFGYLPSWLPVSILYGLGTLPVIGLANQARVVAMKLLFAMTDG